MSCSVVVGTGASTRSRESLTSGVQKKGMEQQTALLVEGAVKVEASDLQQRPQCVDLEPRNRQKAWRFPSPWEIGRGYEQRQQEPGSSHGTRKASENLHRSRYVKVQETESGLHSSCTRKSAPNSHMTEKVKNPWKSER